jgi:hypothetical protein
MVVFGVGLAAGVAVAACALPARRATAIDILTTIRHDWQIMKKKRRLRWSAVPCAFLSSSGYSVLAGLPVMLRPRRPVCLTSNFSFPRPPGKLNSGAFAVAG